MHLNPEDIHIITGPTASGKSSLALEWALKNNGYIINADSMQIYGNFPILSAQPSIKDTQQVPHYLYGIQDVSFPYSAATWVQAVSDILKSITGTPIIVGGTGFYLMALLKGFSPIPEIDPEIRQYVRSLDDPYLKLFARDPEIASSFKRQDRQRLARALEVILSTGKSLLYWQSLPPIKLINRSVRLHMILPDRQNLYKRIDKRCVDMLKNGAIDEVQHTFKQHGTSNLPGLKTIGYQEISQFLGGKITQQQALILTQTASRQYAKRQYTWIRHQLNEYNPMCITPF